MGKHMYFHLMDMPSVIRKAITIIFKCMLCVWGAGGAVSLSQVEAGGYKVQSTVSFA